MTAHIPEPLRKPLAELARKSGCERLVLFGSRARGDHQARSDIDLAVYGLDYSRYLALRGQLEELPTLLEFDLVNVGSNTEPALVTNIQREGVTLYAAAKD